MWYPLDASVGMRFTSLRSATTEQSTEKQQINKEKRRHNMLTWKTQMWEKPRQSTDCKKSLGEMNTMMGKAQRQRPLAPLLRHTAVTMEATTSLSLSLYTVTHTMHIQLQKVFNNNLNCFALTHIYTHMTFGLFTHMAPMGSLGHIYVCVPSNRSGGSPPGLRSSGSS